MIRRLLFETLLFLLPFALYWVYLRVIERESELPRRAHPWTILFISGLILVAGSFIFWGVTEGSGEQGVYIPPHLENGRVVPGQVVPDAPP